MGEKLDERTLHELEEVLQTKIYPGTEIMKDVGSHHFVKGKENVLIPQPSDDPHDPLNWSTKWKMITMFCATMLSFSQNFGPLSLAPLFGNASRLGRRTNWKLTSCQRSLFMSGVTVWPTMFNLPVLSNISRHLIVGLT